MLEFLKLISSVSVQQKNISGKRGGSWEALSSREFILRMMLGYCKFVALLILGPMKWCNMMCHFTIDMGIKKNLKLIFNQHARWQVSGTSLILSLVSHLPAPLLLPSVSTHYGILNFYFSSRKMSGKCYAVSVFKYPLWGAHRCDLGLLLKFEAPTEVIFAPIKVFAFGSCYLCFDLSLESLQCWGFYFLIAVFVCHQRICKNVLKLHLFCWWKVGLLWVTSVLDWCIAIAWRTTLSIWRFALTHITFITKQVDL